MKRILSIGDTHGKDCTGFFNKIDDYDKIIFIGDYVDSFLIPDTEILKHLWEIIEFKKQNKDKVFLLRGNHDLQYLYLKEPSLLIQIQSLGLNSNMKEAYYRTFSKNYNLFNASYYEEIKEEHFLWTHAGLSRNAYNRYFKDRFSLLDLIQRFQELFDNRDVGLFKVGGARGGRNKFGSIFWADAEKEFGYLPKGIHQVAGHTITEHITCIVGDYKGEEPEESITFIDTSLPRSFEMKEGFIMEWPERALEKKQK